MAESWVRVESEGELRAGIWVEVRPCYWCRRRERIFLAIETAPRPFLARKNGPIQNAAKRAFSGLGCCRVHAQMRGNDSSTVFHVAIREGRLYRLVLDEPAAEETERTRERERTR